MKNPFKIGDWVYYLESRTHLNQGEVTYVDENSIQTEKSIAYIPISCVSFTPFNFKDGGFSHERPVEEVTEKHIGRLVFVEQEYSNGDETALNGTIGTLTGYNVKIPDYKYEVGGVDCHKVRLATKDEVLATFNDEPSTEDKQ